MANPTPPVVPVRMTSLVPMSLTRREIQQDIEQRIRDWQYWTFAADHRLRSEQLPVRMDLEVHPM